MKSLILNEIYSANLRYHLFLSCYIFKYVVIIDGEYDGYGENPSNGESPSPTLFLFMRGWRWGRYNNPWPRTASLPSLLVCLLAIV